MQGLKRPLSEESIEKSSEYSKDLCLGCGKKFARLYGHIRQAKCKDAYDMDKFLQEIEAEKKNNRQQRNQRYREKQSKQSGEEQDFQEKKSAERQHQRMQEMKEQRKKSS